MRKGGVSREREKVGARAKNGIKMICFAGV